MVAVNVSYKTATILNDVKSLVPNQVHSMRVEPKGWWKGHFEFSHLGIRVHTEISG